MRNLIGSLVLLASMTAMVPLAAAQEPSENLLVPYGMGAYAGGGVGGFTDEDMRDLTGTAGAWEARLQFGTRLPVSFEAAYIGGSQSIDALGLDTDARLMSTTLEGAVRVNLVQGPIQPYAFAGLGWRRFDLTNVNTNTSSVEDADNLLAVPLGVGLGYRYDRMIADLRGTFRASAYEDLVPTANTDEALDLSTWDVSARIGFEF